MLSSTMEHGCEPGKPIKSSILHPGNPSGLGVMVAVVVAVVVAVEMSMEVTGEMSMKSVELGSQHYFGG